MLMRYAHLFNFNLFIATIEIIIIAPLLVFMYILSIEYITEDFILYPFDIIIALYTQREMSSPLVMFKVDSQTASVGTIIILLCMSEEAIL